MNKRRDFIKHTGLSGLGLVVSGMMQAYASTTEDLDRIKEQAERTGVQKFNMCGFAAPKLDVVRIGVVGIGGSTGHCCIVGLDREQTVGGRPSLI